MYNRSISQLNHITDRYKSKIDPVHHERRSRRTLQGIVSVQFATLVPRVSSHARASRNLGFQGQGKGKGTLCVSARTQSDDLLTLFAVIHSPVDSRFSLTQR